MPKAEAIIEKRTEERYDVMAQPLTDGPMLYLTVEFESEGYENIMREETTAEGARWPEWPPTRTAENRYIVQNEVARGKPEVYADKFSVMDPTSVTFSMWKREDNAVSLLDVYFVDRTVSPPIEELIAEGVEEHTWYVSPWANPAVKTGVGIVGVAVATGAITKWLGWW